jgi:hypothetical protein
VSQTPAQRASCQQEAQVVLRETAALLWYRKFREILKELFSSCERLPSGSMRSSLGEMLFGLLLLLRGAHSMEKFQAFPLISPHILNVRLIGA